MKSGEIDLELRELRAPADGNGGLEKAHSGIHPFRRHDAIRTQCEDCLLLQAIRQCHPSTNGHLN
jgi:hypothetical protein